MERKQVVIIAVTSSIATLTAVLIIFVLLGPLLTKWTEGVRATWEARSIVSQVGKVVRLPEGEKPKVAIVANPSELTAQDPFFKLAEQGDAVLMYEESGVIVLFDLKEGKVRNMALIATSSDPVVF